MANAFMVAVLSAGSAFTALSVPALVVQAQGQAMEAFVAVVNKDDVGLNSGPATFHYSVGTLKAGTLLKVDKEEGGYYRVEYPAGMKAFVKAEEVSVDATGKTAKLIKPSRLLAANANGGARGSWWNLVPDKDFAAGTELKVMDAVKDDTGKTTMYAIVPPATARAFINKTFVRKATAEEAANFGKAAAAGPTTTPADGTKTPAGSPAAPKIDGSAIPGTTPVERNPASNPATPDATSTPPAVITVPVVPTPAPVAPPSKAEQLAALFAAVKAQPDAEAESQQAMVEIQKHIATLDGSAAAAREKKYLQKMVDFLKLRADIQDGRRKALEANVRVDAATLKLREEIRKLEAQAVYTAIGRLTQSAVYDGTRLPKLYRLVSPEPGVSRTIGYILPDASLDLDGKIGRVVGIVGESRVDDSLKANVLTPKRIDIVSLAAVLSTTPEQGNAPAPAGEPGEINK